MPSLLVAISAHGLGHLGQTAPVCNALIKLCPSLRITIWSELPKRILEKRIHGRFSHIPLPCDLGLVMHNAMQVNVLRSWQNYSAREEDWDNHLAAACALVESVKPTLIVSDIGDLPLAAAQALNVPCISMSSLNWADTISFYFKSIPKSEKIINRLKKIYDLVPVSFRLTPGMPMRGQHEQILPPVGTLSVLDRCELVEQFKSFINLDLFHRPRILIGLGGIETPLTYNQWPNQSKLTLLLANQRSLPSEGLPQKGIVNADAFCDKYGITFNDLLMISQAVICKPGYATFVEAYLSNTPVLYVKREDWPEQPVLIGWLKANARCLELPQDFLIEGNLENSFQDLLKQRKKTAPTIDGASLVASKILKCLDAIESNL